LKLRRIVDALLELVESECSGIGTRKWQCGNVTCDGAKIPVHLLRYTFTVINLLKLLFAVLAAGLLTQDLKKLTQSTQSLLSCFELPALAIALT